MPYFTSLYAVDFCDLRHIRKCIKYNYRCFWNCRSLTQRQDGSQWRRCTETNQTHDGLHWAGGQWESRGDRRQGGGGVQHREGAIGPAAEAEDHGVLREEGEASWAAEEDPEQQHAEPGEVEGVEAPRRPRGLGPGGGQAAAVWSCQGQEEVHGDSPAASHSGHVSGALVEEFWKLHNYNLFYL